jgi:hypothetical protein
VGLTFYILNYELFNFFYENGIYQTLFYISLKYFYHFTNTLKKKNVTYMIFIDIIFIDDILFYKNISYLIFRFELISLSEVMLK